MVPPIIRTAGFPQYGWKVGRSDGALPVVYEKISCPAVGIRPSCTSLPVASYPRSESGDAVR